MKIKKMIMCLGGLVVGGVSAKDLPLNGRDNMNHDYTCIGVSTGRDAALTVQEMPGGASTVLIAENTPKPIAISMVPMDDQTRASRQYKFTFSNGAEEVLLLSSITGIATVTMLNAVGMEVFTSLVCHEDR
ncbi:hypothetical protein EEN59_18520 [Salmonella enterica]|nr:hypothetical protein [Salmonella enterica]EGU7154559.1 hypothetical protein [Salmonella enterica]EGV6510803.1 hypothetical protein [Salmonella enterica]EJX7215865.1 hypothetical protein [Salmonella enterica]ELP4866703.1 hypothetical protein [Salmonella enterica]